MWSSTQWENVGITCFNSDPQLVVTSKANPILNLQQPYLAVATKFAYRYIIYVMIFFMNEEKLNIDV